MGGMNLNKKIDFRVNDKWFEEFEDYIKKRKISRPDAIRYLLSRYDEHL